MFQYLTPRQLEKIAQPRRIISLKVDNCDVFDAIRSGAKPFEFRKEDDKTFELGDAVRLVPAWWRHWDEKGPMPPEHPEPITKLVVSVLRGPSYGVPAGYVVLGLADLLDDGFDELFKLTNAVEEITLSNPADALMNLALYPKMFDEMDKATMSEWKEYCDQPVKPEFEVDPEIDKHLDVLFKGGDS